MTTRPGMSIEEHVQAALQFLEHSDREFETGDIMQGSEKLWGAASHAVTAIAKQRGWAFSKYNHRRNAVHRLAEEYDDRAVVAQFSVARAFRDNFYHDTMEDDMIEDGRPIVHNFVRRIIGMIEESGAIDTSSK